MNLPNTEIFNFRDVVVAGDECLLITPKDLSVNWTDENAGFRSCVVLKNNPDYCISRGFSKFTNWGESPDFQPWDNSWNFQARYKVDGSLLCISKYKGQLIIRTRGNIDARSHVNGHEIDLLIEKYPMVFNNSHLNDEYITILCEWTSPNNVIVVKEHSEPTLTLLNVVHNHTGEYESQDYLDNVGWVWSIPRPEKYEYNSVADCIADVKAWEGKEGVVIYSPDFQTLKKIKSDSYLRLHRISAGICSVSSVLDLFIESPKFTTGEDFYNYVKDTLDYEIAEKIKSEIQQVIEAYNTFIQMVSVLERAINTYIGSLETRKKQAMAIQEQWTGWLVPLGYHLLDKKPLDNKIIKKSLEKILNL
jgi:T4 RnlA family RNA ligase